MPTMILIDLIRFCLMILEVRFVVIGADELVRAFRADPTIVDLWRLMREGFRAWRKFVQDLGEFVPAAFLA